VNKGARGMPRLSEAKKDVISCGKSYGDWPNAKLIRRFGNPANLLLFRKESERGELKHLSTHRRRKIIMIP